MTKSEIRQQIESLKHDLETADLGMQDIIWSSIFGLEEQLSEMEIYEEMPSLEQAMSDSLTAKPVDDLESYILQSPRLEYKVFITQSDDKVRVETRYRMGDWLEGMATMDKVEARKFWSKLQGQGWTRR